MAASGVVFDLDGTLVDSMPVVLAAFAHAVSPYTAPISEDEWRARMGGPPLRILERVLTDPEHVAGAMTRLSEYGETRWKQVRAFEGTPAILNELHLAGLAIGVWTGRDRASAQLVLDEQQIGKKLKSLVCGDDLPNHKPDPAGLALSLENLQLSAKDVVFV